MKILAIFLISILSIAGIMLGFVYYLENESNRFQTKHEPFVRKFIHDFSNSWSINDNRGMYSQSLQNFYDSSKNQGFINFYKSLGKLVKIENFKLKKYERDKDGVQGEFVMMTTFTHGKAQTTIILRENTHGLRIEDISLQAPESL